MFSTMRHMRAPVHKFTRRFATATPASKSATVASSSTSSTGKAAANNNSLHLRPNVSPSTSTTPQYTPTIFESLFNRSKTPRVPLTEVYPTDLPQPTTTSLPEIQQKPTISTLSNGLRVATVPNQSPIASVGVFVDCGARYETPETSGLSHFLELMLMKSTVNRTDFRLVREMSKMGANISVSSSRESMQFSGDCLREYVPALIGTMADIIQNHIFHIEELLEEKEIYSEEAVEREKIMETKMTEAIHEAAYANNTLGMPLYAPVHNLPYITAEALKGHLKSFFTPQRMVISGVGVDHEELVDLVNTAFTSLSADVIDIHAKQPAKYTGGEVRSHRKGDEGLVHIMLAFESASWLDPDLVPMCILQSIMGGGGAFSSGGPGKGMYSRLYNNLLNRYDYIDQATCLNLVYSDSSMFVFYGTTIPEKGKDLVEVLSKEILRMVGPIDSTELNRAKNQLKSQMYMQLEMRALRLDDIGRQILMYGRYMGPDELSAAIDKVTEADIQRVAKNMLATPLTVAAMGDLSYVPRYDIIQQLFKQHQGGNQYNQYNNNTSYRYNSQNNENHRRTAADHI